MIYKACRNDNLRRGHQRKNGHNDNSSVPLKIPQSLSWRQKYRHVTIIVEKVWVIFRLRTLTESMVTVAPYVAEFIPAQNSA